MTRTLVLGGARSGKSVHAERLALAGGKQCIYLATALAGDAEMAARIAHHRARRDAGWITVEETLALGDALLRWCAADRVVVVDCLTLWLSNLLFSGAEALPEHGVIDPPPAFGAQRDALLDALEQVRGDLILVSNEVGLGVVPAGAVSRWFVDEAGRLNQAVAARCDKVVFVAAGLPLVLKGDPC
ncbi:MAG TPA: bifunctional adenosylcobinamide kinase/adenosylcobinamide-phosphate guanylyltransferase [Noviherbaspirillum sp.]|nr:bifunctional adenosylcobinamide kinase/adenosylcobinamide-phosphate guanylyltransferase [Noviherbaspirillum sp.]